MIVGHAQLSSGGVVARDFPNIVGYLSCDVLRSGDPVLALFLELFKKDSVDVHLFQQVVPREKRK